MIQCIDFEQLALGDVMYNPITAQCVDIVVITSTSVEYKLRSDYTGPLGVSDYDTFVSTYKWIRNSPVLYKCWLEPGVQW